MTMGDIIILLAAIAAAIGIDRLYLNKLTFFIFHPNLKGGINLAIVLVSALGLHKLLDQAVPGALFEKGTYQVKVYVYASPDENSVKNYRVPALIEREPSEGEIGRASCRERVFSSV